MLLEKLERQVLADRQIAGMARVMGGDVELPSLPDEVARFEAALVEEPRALGAGMDRDQQELRRALGVS